jgi:hypothetical protein
VEKKQIEKSDVVTEVKAYFEEELQALGPHREETAERRRELESLLVMMRFLPVRDYAAEDPIIPSSLVELELEGFRNFCFVVPHGGGLVLRVAGQPVQVITPQSPLGEALLGRKRGDEVLVEMRGRTRSYRIVGVR